MTFSIFREVKAGVKKSFYLLRAHSYRPQRQWLQIPAQISRPGKCLQRHFLGRLLICSDAGENLLNKGRALINKACIDLQQIGTSG